ncbi:MAG: hypothetical protein ACRBEE_07575 [Arenicella sp.]
MKTPIFEILTWRSKPNVSDITMANVMNEFGQTVEKLPGFLHQALYKNAPQEWLCIYYWQTEQNAHDSNDAVANEPSFHALMSLIEEGSVTMNVLPALQSQGQLGFQ